jgi:hypothetical protein
MASRNDDAVAYALGSLIAYSLGVLGLAAGFVATDSAWWNSIVLILALFAIAALLGWRARSNNVGSVVFAFASVTFVFVAFAFGPSAFR